MNRLLIIFSLLLSNYLVAQEVESTYVYENTEFNFAFDLPKDWFEDSYEKGESSLGITFLSPSKKQLTVFTRQIDSALSLDEFFKEEIAEQEQANQVKLEDQRIEKVVVGDHEMIHLSAKLATDFFSVRTHAYFFVNDSLGYYWAMFSIKPDQEFHDELLSIVKSIRYAEASLPEISGDKDSEEEVVEEVHEPVYTDGSEGVLGEETPIAATEGELQELSQEEETVIVSEEIEEDVEAVLSTSKPFIEKVEEVKEFTKDGQETTVFTEENAEKIGITLVEPEQTSELFSETEGSSEGVNAPEEVPVEA